MEKTEHREDDSIAHEEAHQRLAKTPLRLNPPTPPGGAPTPPGTVLCGATVFRAATVFRGIVGPCATVRDFGVASLLAKRVLRLNSPPVTVFCGGGGGALALN